MARHVGGRWRWCDGDTDAAFGRRLRLRATGTRCGADAPTEWPGRSWRRRANEMPGDSLSESPSAPRSPDPCAGATSAAGPPPGGRRFSSCSSSPSQRRRTSPRDRSHSSSAQEDHLAAGPPETGGDGGRASPCGDGWRATTSCGYLPATRRQSRWWTSDEQSSMITRSKRLVNSGRTSSHSETVSANVVSALRTGSRALREYHTVGLLGCRRRSMNRGGGSLVKDVGCATQATPAFPATARLCDWRATGPRAWDGRGAAKHALPPFPPGAGRIAPRRVS